MARLVIYNKCTSLNVIIPKISTCTDFRTRPVPRTHLSNNMQIHCCTDIRPNKSQADAKQSTSACPAQRVPEICAKNHYAPSKNREMRPEFHPQTAHKISRVAGPSFSTKSCCSQWRRRQYRWRLRFPGPSGRSSTPGFDPRPSKGAPELMLGQVGQRLQTTTESTT